ncbi:chemotaxis protein CheW [Desulfosarcina alkanivorans]|jgi:purine-binding chemotaxis protein CheW|uniref:Chemotaxis protein CheW n=1 Tax=Desulfosarcina alkanivorans TaxID=571177 RepID=A0A5K7Z7J8_9BACT|nr:chemotaxis protein CheW [Desulfosarcina alkanivorans]BBO72487.1 chemotaxis protein CheW [Desulfosarcina alkanivorans]
MNDRFAQTDGESTELTTTKQLVGFVIGEELFGVDILTVQEIIRDATMTAIPDAPDFLEGVINLRGSIIPVIDLRKRLKLVQPAHLNPDTWIIILTVEGRVTGFVVDRVTKVLNVPAGSIKPPPDIVVAGLRSQYIQGVCKMDQRLLILLDFSRILMVDEIKKLKSMKRPKAPVRI